MPKILVLGIFMNDLAEFYLFYSGNSLQPEFLTVASLVVCTTPMPKQINNKVKDKNDANDTKRRTEAIQAEANRKIEP